MTYTPTYWVDYPNTATPITAAALNNIETWINTVDANGLTLTGAGSFATFAGGYSSTNASNTDYSFQSRVTGDTQYRFYTRQDGVLSWGPGGVTSPDTNLYRSAADTLKTDDNFIVTGALMVSGSLAGVGGAWTSYTPALTNCTSPITSAKYVQVGKRVTFYVTLTLTAAQVAGLVGIALPVTASAVMSGTFRAVVSDASPAAFYTMLAFQTTTGRVDLYAENAAGTYTTNTATSSTVPITFATGDVIYLSGDYEAA